MRRSFKYIYGPVPSWRLGSSLGIDLLSQDDKICNFDCVYCQLGPTKKYTTERKTYVPVEKVMAEMGALPSADIDYMTFSGRGEPTLALNLGKTIEAVKIISDRPVAVLTNSSLMNNVQVRKELARADLVVAKLDAFSKESLRQINRPAEGIEFLSILDGMSEFRRSFTGKLALQIMLIDANKKHIDKLVSLTNQLGPDEVQLNTPTRPCAVAALSKQEIFNIKSSFVRQCTGANVVSVYDERPLKDIVSFSDEDTLRRRGKIHGPDRL